MPPRNKSKPTSFKGFDLSAVGNDNNTAIAKEVKDNISFHYTGKQILLEDYNQVMDKKKPTIGIPYVLVVHKLFPMINAFFKELGYNVLLSQETDEEVIAASQKYAQAETCYPVKLIYGHMAYLAERKVDYIFLTSILTMKHEASKVYHNYGCVYMQTEPKLVFESMCLDKKGIQLLNPIFSLDFYKRLWQVQ